MTIRRRPGPEHDHQQDGVQIFFAKIGVTANPSFSTVAGRLAPTTGMGRCCDGIGFERCALAYKAIED